MPRDREVQPSVIRNRGVVDGGWLRGDKAESTRSNRLVTGPGRGRQSSSAVNEREE